jgi:uncharacterized protein YgbK (DUF1537 family)
LINTKPITELNLKAQSPKPLVIEGARREISSRFRESSKWLVILDDDPTGSQSIQNVPVITSWTEENLVWAFSQPSQAFFVLTNSRAMNPQRAAAVLAEVIESVESAARALNVDYSLVMRTDSTLRGHFELETSLLLDSAKNLKLPYDLVIFVPAYLEAGRITSGDIHFVRTDEGYIPVAETDYAKDPAFGFESSNLKRYVEEQTKNRFSGQEVKSVSLEDIRLGGPESVTAKFTGAENGQIFIINAVTEADLDVVALAALESEKRGKRILYRTGPTFVASRLGLAGRPPLSHQEIFAGKPRSGHGLIIVGSHVEITTKQLAQVRKQTKNLKFIEANVARLLDGKTQAIEVERCVTLAAQHIAKSEVLIATSRQLVSGRDSDESLNIAGTISGSLVRIAAKIFEFSEVSWLIAKGGITSSDLITEAVQAKRAMVAGQLFPGLVSVWLNQSDSMSKLVGLPLVVFAGNVGNEDSLASAIEILRGES